MDITVIHEVMRFRLIAVRRCTEHAQKATGEEPNKLHIFLSNQLPEVYTTSIQFIWNGCNFHPDLAVYMKNFFFRSSLNPIINRLLWFMYKKKLLKTNKKKRMGVLINR